MKLSRWVFLVLCGLLCIVLVVPVRSAVNLVDDPGFADWVADVGNEWWNVEVGTGIGDDTVYPPGSLPPSLTEVQRHPLTVSQCVDTSSLLSGGIFVGGSLWLNNIATGSIVVTYHEDDACTSGPVEGGGTLFITDLDSSSVWVNLAETYALPSGGGTYVKITLNHVIDGEYAYFDDIFLEPAGATSVQMMQPSGRAPTGFIAAAALVAIAVVIAFLRRH